MAKPITITEEVRQRIRHPFDIDFFTPKYKSKNNNLIFSSPDLTILKDNLYLLLTYSDKIPLDKKYHMKPDYFCYDYYGTVILAPIIMYVNGVKNFEEFISEYILAPTKYIINQVTKNIIKQNDNEIEEISI